MNIVPLSQLDTSNPGTWPIYYKVLTWVAIVAGIAIGYNQILRVPNVETRESLQSEVDKLKSEVEKLQKDTLNLNKYKQRNAELVEILKSKLKYLPPKEEVPELIESIYDAAVANEIKFERIFPLKEEKEKYYDINPIALETSTSYPNFSKFTQDIAAIQKILNVSNIKIEMQDSYDPLKISGTLQTYVYNFNLDSLLSETTGAKK